MVPVTTNQSSLKTKNVRSIQHLSLHDPMKTPKSESPASIASPRALVTKAPLATARNLPTAQGGMLPCVWGHGWPGNLIRMNRINHDWLVVSTPPKNISQLGWFFPIYGKIKNVPNHQPEIIYLQYRSLTVHRDLQAAVVRCFKKELGVHTAGHKKTKRKLSRGDHDFHHFPPHKMHFLVYQPPFLDKINLHCIPAVSKFGGYIISSCLPLY